MAPPSSRSGFALPAVLVVVGVVCLVFLTAATALKGLAGQTRQATDRVRLMQAALDLEAEAAFLAATRPALAASLAPAAEAVPQANRAPPPPVWIDGRPYAAARRRVSLQDEAGLINLDAIGRPQALRLFAELGVAPDRREALADRLADYLDQDDLRRAAGAEAQDYLRTGLAPPPNAPLGRRSQIEGLLGWREAASPQVRTMMRDLATADPTSVGMNVNTAPPRVLKVLFALSDSQVQAALSRRAVQPFLTLDDLGRATGVALVGDAERVYGLPNGRYVLKVADPSAGLVARARIVLTPDDPERPVWIEERSLTPLSAEDRSRSTSDAPPFPRPAA